MRTICFGGLVGIKPDVMVGTAVSVTVTTAMPLVTGEAPGPLTMTRYCAPLSLPKSGPVFKMLLVALRRLT